MISERMQSAIDFAMEKHKDQRDKGGKLYFGHVLRVALSVLHLGEDYFITAILHDVVEDHDVSLGEIENRWGNKISTAVDSVSRRLFPTKETYMELIERAAANEIGREVKMADLDDNTQPARIAALPIEQQDIVRRYNRAKKRIREVKAKISLEKSFLRNQQMLIDGGGA